MDDFNLGGLPDKVRESIEKSMTIDSMIDKENLGDTCEEANRMLGTHLSELSEFQLVGTIASLRMDAKETLSTLIGTNDGKDLIQVLVTFIFLQEIARRVYEDDINHEEEN